jgi:hypothetical protein
MTPLPLEEHLAIDSVICQHINTLAKIRHAMSSPAAYQASSGVVSLQVLVI